MHFLHHPTPAQSDEERKTRESSDKAAALIRSDAFPMFALDCLKRGVDAAVAEDGDRKTQ